MQLSIIIPVFKVEKYLDKCVQSIVSQEKKDVEIILVDDGSPDNCPIICDCWKYKDSRIKVIHKKNGGLSDARNSGLAIAKGEYVWFVDSDDSLVPNSLSFVSNIINIYKSDAYLFPLRHIIERNGSLLKCDELYTDIIKTFNGLDYLKKYPYVTAQAFIYKRLTLLNNNLQFRVGIYHEDVEFTARAMLKFKTVTIVPTPIYNYLIREEGSIMSTPSLVVKRRESICYIIHSFISLYEKGNHLEKKTLAYPIKRLFMTYWNRLSVTDWAKESPMYDDVIKRVKRILIGSMSESSYTFSKRIRIILFCISPALLKKLNKKL